MCGICGSLYFNHQNKAGNWALVEGMLSKLHHRGPDAQTIRQYGPALLGHTRLKIIDTSDASNQPFETRNGSTKLVYNGECYNFNTIKTKLEQKYRTTFRTRGDTEVLATLLEKEGIKGLNRVNGMFAFAHWDNKQNRLTLARDRLGIKPLYYVKIRNAFHFASEFRALLDVLPSRGICLKTVSEYLAFQSVRGSDTLHPKIKKLLPGEYLIISDTGEITHQTYYKVSTAFSVSESPNFDVKSLKKHFFDAVKRRLISDVPLGAFLSGGIDSTAIVAAMHALDTSTIKTFTLGFEDQSLDERKYARQVAEQFETDHQEVVLSKNQVLEHVKDGVKALDLPSGDAINTYLISKYTKEAGLTVALSGLGGDELFGGYPSAALMNKITPLQWLSHIPVSIRQKLSKWLIVGSSIKAAKVRELLSSNLTPADVVTILRRVINREQLAELKLPHMQPGVPKKLLAIPDTRNGITYHELANYTIPLLLKDTDQTSMAHSLEVRVPFLDHEFVEYAATFPQMRNPKYARYAKGALIEALEPMIPENIYNRPKKGFVLPMERWMKNELLDFTQQGLFESPLAELVPQSVLLKYWNNFLNNNEKSISWSRIWTLATLGHWMQHTGMKP